MSKKQIDLEEWVAKVVELDERGHEIPDQTPLRLPSGFKKPETLAEQVQRLVRGYISRQAADAGFESFEDAEDFEVDGDEVSSPYETFFDPVLGRDISPDEFKRYEKEYRTRYLRAQKAYFDDLDRTEVVRKGWSRSDRKAKSTEDTEVSGTLPEGDRPGPAKPKTGG